MSAGKPTTCKDAIRRWEEENPGSEAATATEVFLGFQWPPIERMDSALAVLAKCERLSLSTNMIEKIAGDDARRFAILPHSSVSLGMPARLYYWLDVGVVIASLRRVSLR